MPELDQQSVDCNEAIPSPAGPAWRAAEALGLDMSLVESNLRLTVAERFERHEQARQAVLALRRAGIEYYGFDPRQAADEFQWNSRLHQVTVGQTDKS